MAKIQDYDNAIAKYLMRHQPRTYFAPTNKSKEKNAKENDDRRAYPFISFYRDSDLHIDENRISSSVVQGKFTQFTKSSPDGSYDDTEYVHSIPVNLPYQVDVWAARQMELLDLSQAIMIDMKSALPVLTIDFGGSDGVGRFHFAEVNWTDNSDVEDENETGKTYRHTISFVIEAFITRKRMSGRGPFDPDSDININLYD